MTCEKCCNTMMVEEDNLRQEWERITYYCEKCDTYYERTIKFKTQSSLVASDEMIELFS